MAWTKVCCRGSGCPSFDVDDNIVLLRDDQDGPMPILSLTVEEWEALKTAVDASLALQNGSPR